MKGMFKKALAGVAAAALAVTGFAAATSTANAAEGDVSVDPATITMVGEDEQLAGRKFGYVKLADYVVYEGTGVEGQEGEIDGQLAIDTVDGDVTDAVVAALEATIDYDENTDGDPMTWVANNLNDSADAPYAGRLREFVTELVAQLEAKGVDVTEMPAGASTGSSVTYRMGEPGLYLIVDITGENDPSYENATASIPMLVGTRVTGESDNLPSENINGVVNVKNEITTVGKTVTGGVPGIGDTKSYTITGEVPNWVGKDLDSASYTFTDKPSMGQSVKFDTIKVTVNNQEVQDKNADGSVNWELTGTGVFENVTGTETVAADGKSSFTIDLTSYLKKAAVDTTLIGKEIKVTYDVVINKDALTNEVTNTVEVNNNGSKAESSTTDQTVEKPAMLSFKKTEADGTTPLAGAQFSLTKEVKTESGTTQETVKVTWDETRQSYVVDPDGTATITSGADGMVTIEGLGEGVYTVTETQAPEGFMQQFKPSFTVTVEDDDTTTVVKYAEKSDAWDLISGTDESNATESKVVVRNVRSITQLPQTGAAGIAMFVVLGLLIAGAGVTVWMKSRGVRNDING